MLAVRGEQQVGQARGAVVLPDQRVREQRALDPGPTAVHGGVEREPLVAGDVRDQPREVGRQRRAPAAA